MIPVHQTITAASGADLPGNCLQAAVASIFELPLDAVPHFVTYPNWPLKLRRWSASFGLYPLDLGVTADDPWLHHTPAHHVLIGGSPRLPGEAHAVVGFAGEIVHDPHPDGGGVTDYHSAIFFVAAHPRQGSAA